MDVERRLLGIKEVLHLTSFSEATLRRRVADGGFPKPVKIGPNRLAWRSEDVSVWMDGLEHAA